ncbi:MAG TPA: hypothetical protein VF526_21350 [Solirubrobacteraceae bacterium]
MRPTDTPGFASALLYARKAGGEYPRSSRHRAGSIADPDDRARSTVAAILAGDGYRRTQVAVAQRALHFGAGGYVLKLV